MEGLLIWSVAQLEASKYILIQSGVICKYEPTGKFIKLMYYTKMAVTF